MEVGWRGYLMRRYAGEVAGQEPGGHVLLPLPQKRLRSLCRQRSRPRALAERPHKPGSAVRAWAMQSLRGKKGST